MIYLKQITLLLHYTLKGFLLRPIIYNYYKLLNILQLEYYTGRVYFLYQYVFFL